MEKISTLIADDNPETRHRLTDFFSQKQDIEVIGCAADGAMAVQMATQLSPDVLLLDLIMPKLDGFAVLESLQSLESTPKIIVLTELSRDDFVQRAMQLKASYYMVKPFDEEVLYHRVHDVTARHSAASQQQTPAHFPAHTTDEQVANLLLSIGIPAHVKGYPYLRRAIGMLLQDPTVIRRITKELYPQIARSDGSTASKVERAMRHAITVAWEHGRLKNVNTIFGHRVFSPEYKPTNGEFIALIADKVGTEGREMIG